MKPAYANLKVAYEYQGRYVDSLKVQVSRLLLQQGDREKEFELQLKSERKKARRLRWRGRLEGAAIGALIGILL